MSASKLEDELEFIKEFASKVYVIKSNDRVVAEIEPDKLPRIIDELKKRFGPTGLLLSTIAGTDVPDENAIRLDYFINIIPLKRYLVIRTKLSRDNPKIKSLLTMGINAALSGECETYDLLGIEFNGNNYLKRGFFVPVDIASRGIYPLRKDTKV